MKNIIVLIITLFISISSFAQQGINYKAIIKDDSGNALVNATNIDIQFTIFEGAALTNPVYTETHTNTSTDANGIVILNIGNGTTTDVFTDIVWGNDEHWLNVQIDIGAGLVDISTTQFMAVPYALNVTGLEAINETNGIGWRLKGRDSNNHGNIGNNAIDLSISPNNSITRGATGSESVAMGFQTSASGIYSTAMGSFTNAIGDNAIAMGSTTTASGTTSTAMGIFTTASGTTSTTMGRETTASGEFSTAMGFGTTASGNNSTTMGLGITAPSFAETAIGSYNQTYTPGANSVNNWNPSDRLFTIGNGATLGARSNALVVLKNGTITAPSFDISEITDDKALITKEYADINLVSSGLKQITENSNVGWRLSDGNPLNYGDTGQWAVDLSRQQTNSSETGATSFASFAAGLETTASGSYAVAMGDHTIASGTHSTALGTYNVENTNTIFAIGDGNFGGGTPIRRNALTLNGSFGLGYDFIIGNSQIDDDPTTQNDDVKFFFTNGALRAGKVSNTLGTEWNSENIGIYSSAFGVGTIASGSQSFATGNSTNATGFYSSAFGFGTIASSSNSMAIGRYNIDDADAQFMVGNGINTNSRSSAFTVKKDGTILALDFDLSEITDDKALVTKEYTDQNFLTLNNAPTGLEQLTESENSIETTGWRLSNRVPLYYGTIGDNAVDLSISGLSSNTGATGDYAFASGQNTEASGDGSTAMGAYTVASSDDATALGYFTTASGGRSTSMGVSTNAVGFASTAMGNSSEARGNHSTAMGISTLAVGSNSVAIGNNTVASASNSLALGIYNSEDSDALLMVGNGNQTNSNTAFKIEDNGDAVFDAEIQSTSTGNANMIPVAYGSVNGSATPVIVGGTGNFSVTRNSTTNEYTINVSDQTLDLTNTAASVVSNTSNFRTVNVTYSGGNMIVHIFIANGTKVASPFQFTIYKL